MFESFLYFNVFIRYEHLLLSVQKWQLFKHFKTTIGSYSAVSHCSFKDTCILLESPFYAE